MATPRSRCTAFYASGGAERMAPTDTKCDGSMKRGTRMGLVVLGLAGLGGLLLLADFLSRGVSTRRQPLRAETFVAGRLRHLAIPRGARSLRTPEPASPDVVKEAMAHFADHCASCHG